MLKVHLDKIVEFIVEDTEVFVHTSGHNFMTTPFRKNVAINIHIYFTKHKYSTILFYDYCLNTYSLTDQEIEYVWDSYRKELLSKISNYPHGKKKGISYINYIDV